MPTEEQMGTADRAFPMPTKDQKKTPDVTRQVYWTQGADKERKGKFK